MDPHEGENESDESWSETSEEDEVSAMAKFLEYVADALAADSDDEIPDDEVGDESSNQQSENSDGEESDESDISDNKNSGGGAREECISSAEFAPQELSDKLWGNDLIWQEITSYLSIRDLVNVSCVNKYFLTQVRSINRFASLAGQTVTGKMEIHTFILSRAIVEVKKVDRHILEELASETFKETEYLELQRLDTVSDEDRNQRLKIILCNCPKLKSFSFGYQNYLGRDYQDFLTDENVKLTFSNLEEFSIGRGRNKYDVDKDDSGKIKKYFRQNKYTRQKPTYKLLSDLNLKLKKFFHSQQEELKECTLYPQLILNSSAETLEELELSTDFTGLERLKSMKFARLRVLILGVFKYPSMNGNYRLNVRETARTDKFTEHLIPFLRNHVSTLTEFMFGSNYGFDLVPFCEIFKNAKKLKTLRLVTRMSFTESFSSINWEFLNTMETLRSFELTMSQPESSYDSEDDEIDIAVENIINNNYNIDHYLTILPHTVKLIKFSGFQFLDRLNELLDTQTSKLLKFENLTELKIRDCRAFLNDEVVQFICKNLTKLRIFKGDFSNVTDFGISGIRKQDNFNSKISLANLKGLTTLGIHCSSYDGLKITLEGLVNSVVFLELIKLSVKRRILLVSDMYSETNNSKSDDRNFMKLLKQNPSLERIKLTFYKPKRKIIRKAQQQFPRIKLPDEMHW